MAISTKLELRQGQQLVMTPQLQQAIRLLQFSNQELCQFIETELERNPLLEIEEPSAEVPEQEADTPERDAGETGGTDDSRQDDDWLDFEKPTLRDATDSFDTEMENVYPDDAPSGLSGSMWTDVKQTASSFTEADTNFEAFATSGLTLREHLTEQMLLALASPADRMMAHYLIDTVDDAGYLHADLGDTTEKLSAPPGMADRVLGILQTLDPPGVCARSLAECLALQLKEQNRYDPQIAAVLDHLDLVAAHNFAALKKLTGADSDDLADMIAEIKRLDPKPGLRFGSFQMQAVVPDISVRPASDGSWIIELNSETLPRLLLDRVYYAKVSKTARNEKEKVYLLECLQSANWLIKSLDQRARTILRVAEEIVRQQDGFFTHGVQHLRPMNLKTVAEAISMHESTISRVTSNKYIATPRGILELKYFFTSAIAASDGDGDAHSSEAVRHRIRQLIDAETPASVLSDDMIVEKLKSDGVDIARRTVAKYREAMRIPSSVQRRRDKRLFEKTGRVA